MRKSTDIIMVTYNRLELTKKSLQSILDRTERPYRLIVVDNGSTDGTIEYLANLEQNGKIDLVENGSNLGLEKALQIGLGFVKSDFFVTVDNDCIAPLHDPDWLTRMLLLLEKYKEYAAIALRPQVLIGVGPIFNTDCDDECVVENNVCGGSYRMMRTQIIREVGGWTDRKVNDGRGNEEFDICEKLKAACWKVGYAKHIWTYHQWGDENWGYEKGEAKMGRSLEHAPKDQEYDPITCEPKIKSNE